jgi:hypothetical protein
MIKYIFINKMNKKVKNPETNRLIDINGNTFNRLIANKKYIFDGKQLIPYKIPTPPKQRIPSPPKQSHHHQNKECHRHKDKECHRHKDK